MLSSTPPPRLRIWPGIRVAIRSSVSREDTIVWMSLMTSSICGVASRFDILRRAFSSDLMASSVVRMRAVANA